MTSLRILHVDDDSDIRAVVELSLNLDPDFSVMSCANGNDALAIAAKWAPDLILCDVMMPGMDGPIVLALLRQDPRTAKIPVAFMTGRAQTSEIEQLKLFGAVAVFIKPFDPLTLAAMVRSQFYSTKLNVARYNFVDRLRTDAATLAEYRTVLGGNSGVFAIPEGLRSCVHKLSGAAGIFNFQTVSATASALEQAIIERHAGRGAPGMIEANLDALLECIERSK